MPASWTKTEALITSSKEVWIIQVDRDPRIYLVKRKLRVSSEEPSSTRQVSVIPGKLSNQTEVCRRRTSSTRLRWTCPRSTWAKGKILQLTIDQGPKHSRKETANSNKWRRENLISLTVARTSFHSPRCRQVTETNLWRDLPRMELRLRSARCHPLNRRTVSTSN